MPNQKTPIENADKENDTNEGQQKLQPTLKSDTDKNQVTTFPEDVVEV